MNITRVIAKQSTPRSGRHQTTILGVAVGVLIGSMAPSPSSADDTEIFMTQFSGTGVSGGRPKVLVLFDNSGSMRDGVPLSKPDYDVAIDWTDPVAVEAILNGAGEGVPNNFQTDRIYWSSNGNPPGRTTDQYVPKSSNQCNTSIVSLDETGRYTDYVRVWREGQGRIGTEESTVCECQYRRREESCGWQQGDCIKWKKGKCKDWDWDWVCSWDDWSGWNRSNYQISENDCEGRDGERNGYEYDYQWACSTIETKTYGDVDIWRSVEDNDDTRQTTDLECAADIDQEDPVNPNTDDGWASDDSGPFRSNSPGDPWDTWNKRHDSGLTRTLFSGNYLAWYYNDRLIENRTKMEIAQDVVTELVANNPQIDFGMMLFNWNDGDNRNGGRVVKHLSRMEASDRDDLVKLIDDLSPETWTPLCETYYEAYRYIAKPNNTAQTVLFGDDDSSRWPYRDPCSENDNESGICSTDGSYNSPMGDCENIYVVVMTDGKPTYDTDANERIRNLLDTDSCGRYEFDSNQGTLQNCMPKLAKYMFETDLDGQWENGDQRVITYTIGFLTDQALLSDVAEFGGGTYYTAQNAHELADAFQATLTEILSSNTSFAAPAVAVDAYNRTKSLNAEYIAMFRPASRPRWHGNLKKLEMEPTENSDGEEVVDALGNRAIDPVTGNIKDTATTFWTTLGVDGMEVDQGGAGERLILRDPSTRVLLTNTGNSGALEDFDTANSNLLASYFGTSDSAARDRYINWSRGVDVLDEDSDDDHTDTRPWILGDVMHSTPEAINYGNPQDHNAPDVRVIFGTNAGFLHMIDSDTGNESWAFFPKEIASIVPILYENDSADNHPYGIDGSPSVWRYDHNGDGSIVAADGDLIYLFFGLRRGSIVGEGLGGGYYALDITDPDNPVALWQIDRSDLPELAQTWSKPSPTFIPGHDNPVILIGAGYDTSKDLLGIGTADSSGRGLFIIDATDGSLIWGVTPKPNSDTNLNEPGLQHSVPAQVTPLDSNGDGVVDRVYFPDTGGNVWRVDLVGSDPGNWTIFKVAALGLQGDIEDPDDPEKSDRRFMDRIDIALTRWTGLTYDALLLGSGNRAHPLDRKVQNRFYMLRDFGTRSAMHIPDDGDPSTSNCDSQAVNPSALPCAEIPPVITESDLFDATDNLIQDGSDEQKAAARAELVSSAVDGWYIALEETGEKNLSRSITLQGRVFFTTFVPPDPLDPEAEYVCRPSEGTSFLYAVGLHDGTAIYGDWTSPANGAPNKADRSKPIKDHIPDSPVAYFGETEIGLVGVGAGTDGTGIERTGLRLSTGAIYWLEASE